MPRVAPKNPRDSPDLTSGGAPSRHNPEVGIMPQIVKAWLVASSIVPMDIRKAAKATESSLGK